MMTTETAQQVIHDAIAHMVDNNIDGGLAEHIAAALDTAGLLLPDGATMNSSVAYCWHYEDGSEQVATIVPPAHSWGPEFVGFCGPIVAVEKQIITGFSHVGEWQPMTKEEAIALTQASLPRHSRG